MSRPPKPPASEYAQRVMDEYHADFIADVQRALDENDVVVVGMAQNPHVRKARVALDDAGIPYRYIGHGSYLSGYRRRLAIKMWTGWPTFPQVFVRGQLIGGASQLKHALEDGTLRATLDEKVAS